MIPEGAELVWRTTDAIDCPVCGAKAGEGCHIQPGQFAGFGASRRYHESRVDPINDEPIGYLEPSNPDYPMRRIHPLPEPPTS